MDPVADGKHIDYICRSIKGYLSWWLQFPYYSCEDLIEKTSKLERSVAIEDIKQYEANSTRAIRMIPVLMMVLTSFLFSFKMFYHPWVIATTMDFKDLDLNSTNQWIVDDNTIQAFCIQSNCTRFFSVGTQYSLDIRHFPIIPVCYLSLRLFYSPIVFLGPYAMLMHCALGSTVLVYGVITPLIQLYYPLGCETLMFLVAPELTIELMCLGVKKIHEDYRLSYMNYLEKGKEKDIDAIYQHGAKYPIRSTINRRYFHKVALPDTNSPVRDRVRSLGATKSDHQKIRNLSVQTEAKHYISSFMDRFARDCLPSIRTMTWHPKLQRDFVKLFVIAAISISVEGLFVALDVLGRLIVKSHEHDFMREEMYQSGCRGWYLDESGARLVLPPYPTWKLTWNYAMIVDSVIIIIITSVAICSVSLYLMINHELNSWLSEIHSELEVLIEITRHWDRHKGPLKGQTSQPASEGGDHTDCKEMSIRGWLDKNASQIDRRKLAGKIFKQHAVARKLSDTEFTRNRFADQMVKNYISLRLLMNHIKSCTNSMTLLSCATYLACFLIEISTVWHGRLVGQFGSEHIMTTLSCVSWAMVFLALMSKFHAKARKMERTLWTLIALLIDKDPDDNRVRHLRYLWLKQLIQISEEGGIALKVYRMRVTYVNVLQTLLWITSLIALASY